MNENHPGLKQQVRRFYRELWDAHDARVMPSLLTVDCRFRGSLGPEKRGHAGIAEYVDTVHTALGDYRCRIDALVAEESNVFAKMYFSGVHRGSFMGFEPSGQAVGWSGAALFTFAGRLIDEIWVLGDVHGLLGQLQAHANGEQD